MSGDDARDASRSDPKRPLADRRQALFGVLTAGFVLLSVGALGLVGWRILQQRGAGTVDSELARLSPEERREIYVEAAREAGFLYDSVPDPYVARLGKPGIVVEKQEAEVRINNAGLRSRRAYSPKASDRFRIVCLGDSVVFGAAGREEDRFCDQIEEFYATRNVTVDGRKIEALAVGLGSWTLIQETAYLTSRLSAYDPDVILLVSVANDISDIWGVTGSGHLTDSFTPEHRDLASSVFLNRAGLAFGFAGFSALPMGIGRESLDRWTESMKRLRRLVDLQHGREGRILVSVLGERDVFANLYHQKFVEAGISAPLITTGYFPGDENNRLPHDSHPSRQGHGILADHFVLVMDRLGWIPLENISRPSLHDELSLDTEPATDPDSLRRQQEHWIERHVPSRLEFPDLGRPEAGALLGGLLPPWSEDDEKRPWGSLKTGWLMTAPDAGVERAEIELVVPPRPELFPFLLVGSVNGESRGRLELKGVADAGRHRLVLPVEEEDLHLRAFEIVLRVDSYFSELEDHRTKSYQLIRAEVF